MYLDANQLLQGRHLINLRCFDALACQAEHTPTFRSAFEGAIMHACLDSEGDYTPQGTLIGDNVHTCVPKMQIAQCGTREDTSICEFVSL